ncbi:MAG TPA: hypothetical protein VN605_05325 [Thermoanaerobaculia bacterium]|nr:hypothetical protein [Thermoanaerobaculia bacterium]
MIESGERLIARPGAAAMGTALLNIEPLLPVRWPIRAAFAGWPARVERIGPFGAVLKAVILPTYSGLLELRSTAERASTPAIVIGGTVGESAHLVAFAGAIDEDLCAILLEAAFGMGGVRAGGAAAPSSLTLPRAFGIGTRRKFDALYAISGEQARNMLRLIAGALSVSPDS